MIPDRCPVCNSAHVFDPWPGRSWQQFECGTTWDDTREVGDRLGNQASQCQKLFHERQIKLMQNALMQRADTIAALEERLAETPEYVRASIRFSALSLLEWKCDSTRYTEDRYCRVCRCSKELNNRGFIEGDGNFGNLISEFGHELLDAYAQMDGVDRATLPQRQPPPAPGTGE